MALGLLTMPTHAQNFNALSRALADGSGVVDANGSVVLTLALTLPVPFRVFTLDDPRRLVLDFNEVEWSAFDNSGFDQSNSVASVNTGILGQGWSRMVLELSQPLSVTEAFMDTSDQATVHVTLSPTSAEKFATSARQNAPNTIPHLRAQTETPPLITRQTGDRPLVIVLDPGHGGIDPGAERGDVIEADLMLSFSLELQELLLRTGAFEVVLTREDNSFVPLETRVSIARHAGADAFLSLHADSLIEGRASGATIYTLSDSASDVASQKLAERHDRSDLLAGVDLTEQDDEVATVLMELARRETAPRSNKLADALVVGLKSTVGTHKRPKLTAGFSVLKAPDIPSVLVELGFLSSPRDLKQLQDKEWRLSAASGIRDALSKWAIEDAADAELLRK